MGWIVDKAIVAALDRIFPKLFTPAGKYPHNPFVGPRRMKFPYSGAAEFAQFPWVFHWRYSLWFRPLIYSFVIVELVNYKITQFVNRPSNVEEWRVRRNEWYTKKLDPEDAYF